MQKKYIALISLFSLLLFFTGCGQSATENKLQFSTDDVDQNVVNHSNQFGFQLLKQLKEEDAGENIFISPLSISIALAMTVNGAEDETKQAMLEALHQQDVTVADINASFQALMNIIQYSDPSVELSIANSLWAREDKSFFEQFTTANETYYDAKVTSLDFQDPSASKIINDWVKGETRGKIEDIVDEQIDPRTVLFLINAIYFQGDWTEPFDENRTIEKPFYSANGTENDVAMMRNDGEFEYFENDLFQAIRLPYGEGQMVMDVYLPHEDVPSFLEQLSDNQWQEWAGNFQAKQGYLEMPRFTLEYEKSLVDVLKTLGMEIAFDENMANFGNMAEIPPNLYISEVLHKSFIEVNEKGTEAAAATSVEVRTESAPMYDFQMEVNRPFVYAIHDTKTEAVMFIGTVEDSLKFE